MTTGPANGTSNKKKQELAMGPDLNLNAGNGAKYMKYQTMGPDFNVITGNWTRSKYNYRQWDQVYKEG